MRVLHTKQAKQKNDVITYKLIILDSLTEIAVFQVVQGFMSSSVKLNSGENITTFDTGIQCIVGLKKRKINLETLLIYF